MTFEELKEKASSSETLEELFDTWKLAHIAEENYEETTVTEGKTIRETIYPGIEKQSFISDGYISKEDYVNSEEKVLFILKEANILMHRKDEKCNPDERTQTGFYKWFIDDLKSNRPKQQEKMARMAFYLQNKYLLENERKIPTDDQLKQALKSCGYMNLNKRGGDNHDIKVSAYAKKYSVFINKQIELMAPKYIIAVGYVDFEYPEDCIYVWHTAYRMRGKRKEIPIYGHDKNVDLYMTKFFSILEDK